MSVQTMARFLILAAELAEVEGRRLRAETATFAWRLLRGLALAAVTASLLLLGAGLVLAAVFARLEPAIGPVGAALVSAGIAFIGAGATAWTTRALFLTRGVGRDEFRHRAE
jgi:FtsH-binding integral membrane protein